MKQLRIHYLQHVPFETPGYIKTWISKNNHTVSSTKFYLGDTLPAIDDFNWLIVMGGPMGIEDVDTTVVFEDPDFEGGDSGWYDGATSKEFNIKLTPKK